MRIIKKIALAAIISIMSVNMTQAQGLGDLLGGLLGGQQSGQTSQGSNGLGGTLGNLLEGVFSSSNITVADMEGEWEADGPAVCFQSEGFLKQAGGKAAAAAIETKLAPYYEQYGLTNAKLTVNQDGTFTLVTGKITLKGNITAAEGKEKGVFMFNFSVLGRNLMSLPTYVQKTSKSMDVMFDATKFKKLISAVAQFTGIKLAQTLGSLLDSYDGLCVGFHFSGASTQQSNSGLGGLLQGLGLGGSQQNSGTTNQDNSGTTGAGNSNGNSNIGSGLDALRGLLTGGSTDSTTNKSGGNKTTTTKKKKK